MILTITLEQSTANQTAIVKSLEKMLCSLLSGSGAAELKNDKGETTYLIEYDRADKSFHLCKNFTLA